jgi:hypothetical protein
MTLVVCLSFSAAVPLSPLFAEHAANPVAAKTSAALATATPNLGRSPRRMVVPPDLLVKNNFT